MSPGGHLGDPERPRSPTRPSRGPHRGPHRALGAPPDRRGEGHTWPHGALSPGVRRSDPVPQMQLSETLPPPCLRRGSAWEGSSEPGGQEGRPPYLWRLWPVRLPSWGSGAPPSGTHHLPLGGRRERGWGAGAGGCAAPSPGHLSPRAPVGEDPAPGREGSERPDSLQSPRGSGGKPSEMAASPPPHPSGEKAFVTPTGSPRAALGERGTGISPALGGAWHTGPERDRQQGRARLVHRAGVGGRGGPRAPADDSEGPGQLKPRCQGS